MSKKIKIKYVHSPIGRDKSQKETIRCLGLSRLNQVKEVVDNAAIRGMINTVSHLVRIIES